jgi:hypothetical protein
MTKNAEILRPTPFCLDGQAPPGTTLAAFWHLHPGNSPFNQPDISGLRGYPGFLGGADGSIRMYWSGQEYILKGR